MSNAAKHLDLSRFVEVTLMDGPRWRVGCGDHREGQAGQQIGVISLKHVHGGGYGVLMHMDSGKQDIFSPMQLFPVT